MNLEQKAIEIGFDNAVTISTKELHFDFSFRRYCEDNVCGKYGTNYACPPACGTPEEMRERALQYKQVIVLRKCIRIDNYEDEKAVAEAESMIENIMSETLQQYMKAGYIGSASKPGGCRLCEKCELSYARACISPQSIAPCVSAYCIDTKKLAEACNLEYTCTDGTTAYFCLFFYQ